MFSFFRFFFRFFFFLTTGDLPTEIGDFSVLETLSIRDNRFTGEIFLARYVKFVASNVKWTTNESP